MEALSVVRISVGLACGRHREGLSGSCSAEGAESFKSACRTKIPGLPPDDGQHGSNDASEHKNPLSLQGFTPNSRYKLGTTKRGEITLLVP
jgi:hypothetical protein